MIDYIDKNPIKTFAGICFFLWLIYFVSKSTSESRQETENLEKIEAQRKRWIAEWGANYVFRMDSAAKAQEKIRIEQTYGKKVIKLHSKHPDWSYDDCQKLINKNAWIGMNTDMLYYLRGKPDYVNTSNYGNGNQYQMVWNDYSIRCFYTDDTGIISAYN